MKDDADTARRFDELVLATEPRLRRAFTLLFGPDRADECVAESLGWAWEHRAEVSQMSNPAGYLYRVGISRTRQRLRRFPDPPEPATPGTYEPRLVPALRSLSERQRTAVILVHACGWTHQEVADSLGLSRSAVSSHVERAMSRLRKELGVSRDG